MLGNYNPPFIFNATRHYTIDPINFSQIHTVLINYYGIKGLTGKNILEIGASWGPYMHFLQEKYHVNAFGLDINKKAVRYAKRGGLKFFAGDASKIGLRDNSVDILISRNFLDYSYLDFCQVNKDPVFIENVLNEVHRVLKPGGRFFSHFEDKIENSSRLNDLFVSFERMDIRDPRFDIVHSPVNILRKPLKEKA